jgi:lipid-binding SYLF domain-containing protein
VSPGGGETTHFRQGTWIMRKQLIVAAWGLIALTGLLAGCQTADSPKEKEALHDRVLATVERFKTEDPSMKKFWDSAYGYAVFPQVTKGGLVVGGAHGEGELFEKGNMVGIVELSQGTVGAQIGGQGYSEIIFLKDKLSFEEFKGSEYALSAQASAVAAKKGASTDADFEHGVAVFTLAKTGLMAEASVGGQKFKFKPN